MEKVLLDLGACVRDARERLGYEHVVLGGWSGGGSLSLYYQEQAERPSVTATPAGDGPDITAAGLLPADAVCSSWPPTPADTACSPTCLDPAIRDEADPDDRDPALDLYGPDAPQPPYDREWLATLPGRPGRAQPAHHRVGPGAARLAARGGPAA